MVCEDEGQIGRHRGVLRASSTKSDKKKKRVNMRMKIYREDMEEIDWEAMQDDIDLEEVEAMARESEVWLLKTKLTRLQELLEESEWERGRLKRRLQEKEEARMEEEARTEKYMKKCEFYMEYSMSVTAEIKGRKASFLEIARARKKKKKKIQGVNQERETQKMNQNVHNWRQKKNRKNPMTMQRMWKGRNPVRTQAWPGVTRVL